MIVLYHGTASDLLPEIVEGGLRPAHRSTDFWKRETERGEVKFGKSKEYTLTTHYNTAEYYALIEGGRHAVVLEYHIPNVEINRFLFRGVPQTWDYVKVPPGNLQYALKHPLPSRFLRAVHEGETWGEFKRRELQSTERPRPFKRPSSEVRVRSHVRRRTFK